MIGSADSFTRAAGEHSFNFIWYIAYEPTVLPFPNGKQKTHPEMLAPLHSHSGSRILPFDGSMPPKKDTGHLQTTAFAVAFPALIFLADIIVISPPAESWSF